jgi:uncharacterized protein (DUF433 family)
MIAADWTGCAEVERVEEKMSGEPVIKGTRVLAQTIVDNYAAGDSIDEIHENYPHIPLDTIRKVVAFHERHQLVP